MKEKVYKLERKAKICNYTSTLDNPISVLFEAHENSHKQVNQLFYSETIDVILSG